MRMLGIVVEVADALRPAEETVRGRVLTRVRASVHDDGGVVRDDLAVALQACAQLDDERMLRRYGGQVFGCAVHELDRPAEHLRQVVGDRRVARGALAPEIRADGYRVQADIGFIPLEQPAKLAPRRVGNLVGRPNFHALTLLVGPPARCPRARR